MTDVKVGQVYYVEKRHNCYLKIIAVTKTDVCYLWYSPSYNRITADYLPKDLFEDKWSLNIEPIDVILKNGLTLNWETGEWEDKPNPIKRRVLNNPIIQEMPEFSIGEPEGD